MGNCNAPCRKTEMRVYDARGNGGEVCPTLCSHPKGGVHDYEPKVCLPAATEGPENEIAVFDARGNGEGGVCPTITGDHENRITDYTAILCYNDRRRCDYHIAEGASPTVTAKYGTGGGQHADSHQAE